MGRASAAAADPERVPADGGSRRSPRHGRLRSRRRALLCLDALPRDADCRHRRTRAGPLGVRRSVQHRPASLGSARWAARAPDAAPEPRAVSGQPAHPAPRTRHHRDRRRYCRHAQRLPDRARCRRRAARGLPPRDRATHDRRTEWAAPRQAAQRAGAVNNYAVGRGQPASAPQAVPPCQTGRRSLPPLEGLGHLRGAHRE